MTRWKINLRLGGFMVFFFFQANITVLHLHCFYLQISLGPNIICKLKMQVARRDYLLVLLSHNKPAPNPS